MRIKSPKRTITVLLAVLLVLLLSVGSFAESAGAAKFTGQKSELVCIARCDTQQDIDLAIEFGTDAVLIKYGGEISLADALGRYPHTLIIIDCSWADRDEVYSIITEKNLIENCIIIARAKKGEVSEWLRTLQREPMIIQVYSGNVIWNLIPNIKSAINNEAQGILLSSGNPYSVAFSKNIISRYTGKIRFVADMTKAKTAGKRSDTAIYWDDITSRGFSAIITDDVRAFNEYKQRLSISREKLGALISEAEETDRSMLSSKSALHLENEIKKANQALSYSVSAKEADEAYIRLSGVLSKLSDGKFANSGELTLTAGRIIAAVIITAVFIASELFINHMRKKRTEYRRNGLDKKGRPIIKEKEDNN